MPANTAAWHVGPGYQGLVLVLQPQRPEERKPSTKQGAQVAEDMGGGVEWGHSQNRAGSSRVDSVRPEGKVLSSSGLSRPPCGQAMLPAPLPPPLSWELCPTLKHLEAGLNLGVTSP